MAKEMKGASGTLLDGSPVIRPMNEAGPYRGVCLWRVRVGSLTLARRQAERKATSGRDSCLCLLRPYIRSTGGVNSSKHSGSSTLIERAKKAHHDLRGEIPPPIGRRQGMSASCNETAQVIRDKARSRDGVQSDAGCRFAFLAPANEAMPPALQERSRLGCEG